MMRQMEKNIQKTINKEFCRKVLYIRQNFYFFTLGKKWKLNYNINQTKIKEAITLESKFYEKDKLLVIKITDEIDDYSVQKIRRRADYEIERYMPKKVIFDFNSVTFMDSAGIGLIIGRYKFANMLGGKLEVANLTQNVKKIFEMSGILKLIPITEDPIWDVS